MVWGRRYINVENILNAPVPSRRRTAPAAWQAVSPGRPSCRVPYWGRLRPASSELCGKWPARGWTPWTLWSSSQRARPANEADQRVDKYSSNFSKMEKYESGQDVLPLTCWSRQRHPHLGSRRYSGLPLNRLLLSGALTRPVRHGHTHTHNDYSGTVFSVTVNHSVIYNCQ